MRDLSFLHGELPASDEPGLDTHDPRFLAITQMIESDDASGAADATQELIQGGIYDIRLICHYLGQVFEEEGLPALGLLLGGLDALLAGSANAVGPARNRDKYVEKSLCSLFTRIGDLLEFHRKKQDDRYLGWCAAVDASVISEAVTAGERLVSRLVLPVYPHSGELLGRVLREMREVRALAIARESGKEAPMDPGGADESAKTIPPARQRLKDLAALAQGYEMVSLRVSPRFAELCLKLQAFEALVQKRNFEKAALVSDDLMALIEGFDPRLYFPELFAAFSAQLSGNVSALAPHWDRRETLEWKTLKQFYQVDLDAFVGKE